MLPDPPPASVRPSRGGRRDARRPRALALGCSAALCVSCTPTQGPDPSTAASGAVPERTGPNAVVAVPEAPATPAAMGQNEAVSPAPTDAPTVRGTVAPTALRPPEGYVEMTVVGVAPTADGDAVLLVDEERSVIVPIFVGNTEALAIELRHRKERFARPLTHDLLDAVLRELGGVLIKVQVDDIKGKTFVGSVFIRTGGRTVALDARPSDAIALALGSHAPIFVARRVVREGGIRKDQKAGPDALPDIPHI